jgi:hypothetical protein
MPTLRLGFGLFFATLAALLVLLGLTTPAPDSFPDYGPFEFGRLDSSLCLRLRYSPATSAYALPASVTLWPDTLEFRYAGHLLYRATGLGRNKELNGAWLSAGADSVDIVLFDTPWLRLPTPRNTVTGRGEGRQEATLFSALFRERFSVDATTVPCVKSH